MPDTRIERVYHAVFLGVLTALAAAIYLPFSDSFYVADDYFFLFGDAAERPSYYLFEPIPSCAGFRPLQAFALAALQSVFGPLSTVPVHSWQIGVHVLLAALVYIASLRLGLSDSSARIAALIVVTSQSSVLPVLSIDTMSQQLVVVFGVSALWVWWRWLHTSTGSGARFVLSILLLSLSFGAKESALGVSLAFVLLAGIHVWNRPERWGRTLLGLAPAIGVTLSYVIYRSTLPVRLGTFGEGRYDLHLGLNIPVNALQLVAGTIVPFPTSWLYKLSQDVGSWLAFGIISASSAVILAVMVRYRPAAGEVRPWLILILPLVLSTPVIVLNHVSELYTYTLLPFVGLIAGAAFGRGIRIEKGATRGFLIGLLAILLVAQSVSSVYKANQLHRNGEISRSLFLDLEEHVVHAPQYSTFRLCADEIVPDRYSSFIMGPLDTVFGGLRSVLDYYGRSDLRLHPTTRCDDAPEPYDPDLEVRLWFDGTRGRFHCSTSTNSRRTQACPSSNHLLPLPIVEENP